MTMSFSNVTKVVLSTLAVAAVAVVACKMSPSIAAKAEKLGDAAKNLFTKGGEAAAEAAGGVATTVADAATSVADAVKAAS